VLAIAHDLSFYFFDIDDNLLFLSTAVYVTNSLTRQEIAVTTGEFATIEGLLGHPGKWGDYRTTADSFRNFRDLADSEIRAGKQQPFLTDIAAALNDASRPWQGPSWPLLVHAARMERPISFVTARGHSPETIKAGFDILTDRGFLPREPKYLTIYPVSHENTRRELGDAEFTLTVPALKKRAIMRSVERALEQYGHEPAHRFGMSDDDPRNIELIIMAMRDCKARYMDKRFFAINTNVDGHVKLEVFPADFPVTAQGNDGRS